MFGNYFRTLSAQCYQIPCADTISNILLVITQEHPRNPFTKKMRVVYKACVENKGPGITKRSLVRIHDVLLDTGARSPFATLVRVTAKWLTTIDEIHIKNKLQESVARILDQVHETMDGLLSEKVEDEEEIAAKAHLQQLLPTLLSEWEQVDRDLQALMMKYGLQPKFGRSQVMVKVE